MAIEIGPILPDRKYLVQRVGDRKQLYDDIHPVKIAQARLNDLVYDLKQRAATEAEAEFWERTYAKSERAQRVWEQKQA